MRDIQEKLERLADKDLLIRVILGINPCHDTVESIRVLYEDGREAFEKMRGPACDYAMHNTVREQLDKHKRNLGLVQHRLTENIQYGPSINSLNQG